MKRLLALSLILLSLTLLGGEKVQVIYIHGWNPTGEVSDDELPALQKIFPDAEISLHSWNSVEPNFEKGCLAAENEAKKIAAELVGISDRKLHNIILVGHSLGGRIAIRVMAHLAKNGKKIRQGIFLGSAIADDDEAIASAISGSILPNINIYNRQDYVLRHAYMAYNTYKKNKVAAFGSFGYAYECKTSQLRQLGMANDAAALDMSAYIGRMLAHNHIEYLTFLQQNMSKLTADYPERIDSSTAMKNVKITPPLAAKYLPPLPDEASLISGSRVLDIKDNWRLLHFYKHIKIDKTVWGRQIKFDREINLYYIMNDRDRIVYYTVFRDSAENEFANVKQQL